MVEGDEGMNVSVCAQLVITGDFGLSPPLEARVVVDPPESGESIQ